MLNLDVWKEKDLQHFVQMLNQCESEGMTDIRAIRQRLHNKLYPPKKVRPVRGQQQRLTKCQCGRGFLRPVGRIEGLERIGCIKCLYSEVVK